ncbi:unnamed protein product [Spirodela intermedia]|uniref:Uncharacterized protein n=1 Tax=Spirodela intermedia TaxID=51605 RepID=A0A7I8JXU0_SPIIN|nr:unnamed protein product [Spirodela intermedia]
MQEQSGVLGQPGRSRMKDPAKAAAGAAVDCAVICCCCPWGLANLLVLAVVKVPAHLCRRAFRNGRTKINKYRTAASGRGNNRDGDGDDDDDDLTAAAPDAKGLLLARERSWGTPRSEASLEREEEIWKPFYATGFWRTLSQQGSESSPIR